MSRNQTSLARKNLDKRLTPVRNAQIVTPPRGWAKAIREALGMTTRQLAERMGVAPSRVTTIEKAETTGAVTLKTLRETAAAMDCQFIYAFVPDKPLEDIFQAQAARKARHELAHLNHTMRLENQALTAADLADEERRLTDEWRSARRLWDKE